jgi:ATP-binding protein involved in chromosome partitioning
VPLSLSQKIPLAGAVIVCTPQDVALLDAIRALNMFRQLNVPILGVIENMSHFLCPHCGGQSDIFGHGGARAAAEKQAISFLGEIPLDLQARINCDQGRLKDNFSENSAVRPYLTSICENLVAQLDVSRGPELPTLV